MLETPTWESANLEVDAGGEYWVKKGLADGKARTCGYISEEMQILLKTMYRRGGKRTIFDIQ